MKKFNDIQETLVPTDDEKSSVVKKEQHVPKDFLKSLEKQRDDSFHMKERDYMSVASIPVAVHEQWLKEGFDLMKEPAHKIVARLKQQNLDAFVTTKKRV